MQNLELQQTQLEGKDRNPIFYSLGEVIGSGIVRALREKILRIFQPGSHTF